LVTGATGFIGSYICRELSEKGAVVRGVTGSRPPGGCDSYITCILGEDTIPPNLMKDVDIVFHLAGCAHSSPEKSLFYQTNVDGTRDLLYAAKNKNVEKFIYFSSVKAICEEADERLDESTQPHPTSVYGKSKLEAEKLVLDGGFVDSPTVLRLPMVYGITRKGNLPKMIGAISKNLFPPLPRVKNKRSMIHVDDVVQGAILVATNQVCSGKAYILTDDIDYSARQLYELICKSHGKKIPKWAFPTFLFYTIAKVGGLINSLSGTNKFFNINNYEKLFGNSYFSCDRAQTELGFRPKHTLDNSIDSIVSAIQAK